MAARLEEMLAVWSAVWMASKLVGTTASLKADVKAARLAACLAACLAVKLAWLQVACWDNLTVERTVANLELYSAIKDINTMRC